MARRYRKERLSDLVSVKVKDKQREFLESRAADQDATISDVIRGLIDGAMAAGSRGLA